MISNLPSIRWNTPIQLIAMVFLINQAVFVYAQNSTDQTQFQASSNSELVQSIDRYEQALVNFNGIYDQSITEAYLGLANANSELGNFEEANRVYGEALQSIRITNGLYAEQQLALLELYTMSASFERDWTQVDNNLNLSSHIASRIYENNDPRYLDAVSQFASWKIRSHERDIYGDRNDISLREAIELYEDLIAGLLPASAHYSERLASYLSAKGMAHYYSALYTASISLSDFPSSVSEFITIQRCRQEVEIVDGRRVVVQVCEQEEIVNPEYFVGKQIEKDTMVQSRLSQMRNSFRRAADTVVADPQATLEQRARAILNLGDINFLIQEYGRANTQYSRVDELLSTDGVLNGLRDRLIGESKQVMVGVLDELPFDAELDSASPIGIVSFDVTRTGDIQNINIAGSFAALEDSNQALVMEKLSQSVYRPKIVEGRPIESRLRVSADDL